jgi:thiol-disulfide isomerase/thioredoxin
MYKKLLQLLVTVCCVAHLQAQQSFYHELKIGDAMPALTLHMLNYDKNQINLSQFNNRLLILDYWFTSCSVCIAQFPKLYALQQRFGDSIFILPVGFDGYSKGSVESFISKRKNTPKAILLPVALQRGMPDTALMYRLFPYSELPHEVWIYKGVVVAITDHNAVTDVAIENVLLGNKQKFIYKDFDRSFLPQDILFSKQDMSDSMILLRSIILPYRNGLGGTQVRDSNNHFTRIAFFNKPPYFLLKEAFINAGAKGNIPLDCLHKTWYIDGEVSLRWDKMMNTDTMNVAAAEAYREKNYFSYELILPPGSSMQNAYSIMLAELQQFFNISVTLRTQKINCLFLVRKDILNDIRTRGGASVENISEDGLNIKYMNQPVNMLIDYLNCSFTGIPFILDKTRYSANIDIELNLDSFNDVGKLRRALMDKGLDLIPGTELLNTIFFTPLNK